jgi:hypothetical protein
LSLTRVGEPIRIFEADTGKVLPTSLNLSPDNSWWSRLNPDGSKVITCTLNGALYVGDIAAQTTRKLKMKGGLTLASR